MSDISRKAIVERGAKLARDVRVGPFCHIGPGVRIGAGCTLESHVTIAGATTIGEKTHVLPMAVIGLADDGQDDPAGQCVLGMANTIREHVTVRAGRDRPTRIGSGNLIMVACEIGPGAVVGDHGIFANCTHVAAGAVVEDYVRTSGFAMVGAGATVGAYTFIAGHAVIDRFAPPFAIVQSFPYRVRWVNAENLKRCGFAEEDIRALREAFKILFDDDADHARPARLDELPADLTANAHVGRLVEFLRARRDGGTGGDHVPADGHS